MAKLLLDGNKSKANNETSDSGLKINSVIISFCPNCGCGNPKKTYDGYWCKMCKTELQGNMNGNVAGMAFYFTD